MAEPQPSNVTEGADAPDVLPASNEDRKAAAALSSLDAKPNDEAQQPKKEVDLKALGEAMKNLEIASGAGATSQKSIPAGGQRKESASEPKKLVKVDAGDVNLLVSCSHTARSKQKNCCRRCIEAENERGRSSNWICPRRRLQIC